MKKFFVAIILALVCFCGCSKHEVEPNYVTISFDKQLVSSNSMTRSTANDFLDIIEEHTSDYVNVTLTNTDLKKTFTCKSNESITIPVGNYNISAYYDGLYVTVKPYEYREYPYSSTPSLKCNTFSKYIDSTNKHIILSVHYSCYAIFALIDECDTPYFCYKNGDECPFPKYNKYYIAYFNEDAKIKLTPYEDSNEFIGTQYEFSTTYDKSKVYAEYGRYYVIHPQSVDKVTSSFTLEIPDMIEGEI